MPVTGAEPGLQSLLKTHGAALEREAESKRRRKHMTILQNMVDRSRRTIK